MRKLSLFLLLVLCGHCPAHAEMRTIVKGLPPVDWDQDTLSLPPAYFPEMPQQLRAWLEEREYRIPQVHDIYIEQFTEGFQKRERYNVISGDFDGQDDQDWAFATFRDDTLNVFICWNADTTRVEQMDISEFDKYHGGYASSSADGKRVLTFKIMTSIVRKSWLNDDISSNLKNLYGDSTDLPEVFNHDGFILDSGGDMWDGGYIRYLFKNHWIYFRHHEAETSSQINTIQIH